MTRTRIWHPFTQHGLGEPIPNIVRTEGAYLWMDTGERLIDAISSWWVTTHGHAHPSIAAAIAEAAAMTDQIIFAGHTHLQAEAVADGLAALFPAELAHIFFSDSGSTAVEVALKMALGFWAARGEGRHRILVLEGSYHGDTIGAMSVGARGVFNAPYAPLLFDVGTIPFPGDDDALDTLEAACREHAAALIVEPLVLGAGGMRMYAPERLAAMAAICARHGVLFIADEVMTGWGRTGALTACEQAGVVPDIMCLSKGLTGGSLPLAVTLASAAIYDAHYAPDRSRMFFHSSSYTANPIACAAAAANLAIWREEPVLERVAALSVIQADWVERAARWPGVIGARRLGTIAAFEVEDMRPGYLSALGPAIKARCAAAGVLIRPLGNTVYVMPPYCVSSDDLAQVYGAIENAIRVR
ncbi:adenosylmethionine--8-amino-7-oxononanoate transaminase [Sphingomonas spermidinifaciens]|uniref:Adenosylmethionine-8-amino-7-oxononanoate aminotransferase n=1 Tax=Sphingomonas spermidinifaciens TaxID=1141889 RepID=A0A2A4B301_9SPHN|nr:adenosylmethionine--8-amino-7-oxononanoate transaminase [Sphingomonas spermidinifaciens]PCD03573.1 adenosylmethionine--8-amino-7-oxononanoate transaminase [Sphingomonas spermidinifaciens]